MLLTRTSGYFKPELLMESVASFNGSAGTSAVTFSLSVHSGHACVNYVPFIKSIIITANV